MKLNQTLQSISSSQDLAGFLRELLEDYCSNSDNWENHDLERFLAAASAWLADMEGYYVNRDGEPPQQPTWKTIGEIFLAAKYYE